MKLTTISFEKASSSPSIVNGLKILGSMDELKSKSSSKKIHSLTSKIMRIA